MAGVLLPATRGVTVKRILVSILAAAGFSFPAVVTQPDPLEIVRKSVEAIETNWKQAPNYSFVERENQSKKEGEPTIKSYEVLMIDGSPYRRLIAIDDKPLSPGEQAEEDRKMRDEIDKRQHESDREEKKLHRPAAHEEGRHGRLNILPRDLDVVDLDDR